MWREKNIYFTEPDIYFTKLVFILKNINLELKSALRTKYIFYRFLLYIGLGREYVGALFEKVYYTRAASSSNRRPSGWC